MLAAAALLFALNTPSPVPAVTAPAAAAAVISPILDNVSLGQPLSSVRDRNGDPVAMQNLPAHSERIWRFLENGNRFLDVMERDGVAVSITVAQYGKNAAFTDQRGVSFGMSGDAVTKILGQPERASRNLDDGSVDLWYRGSDAVLIYEFGVDDRLEFEQLLAPHTKEGAYAPAPVVEPRSGASAAEAIDAAAPADAWIRAYFSLNACEENGTWEVISMRELRQGSTYEVIHARCSSGNLIRDFYFQLPAATITAMIPNFVIAMTKKAAVQSMGKGLAA